MTARSAADLIELALLLLLIAFVVAGPAVEAWARRLGARPILAAVLLALLPVVLRLALLPNHPPPTPDVYDEFSHLLVADTLRHFRLANPPHPLHQFFETIFVLQQPTYSSIYPLGQGMALAIGRAVFGLPWAGVVLCTAAFCGLCLWMLRGWVSPEWALLGGVLALIEFGPLNAWMNTYWGGALPAAAGCMVFGALPRLRATWRPRDAILLGAGLGIHFLARPFESVLLALSVIAFLAPHARRLTRPALVAVLTACPAVLLILAQNKAVTGSWTTLPYVLSRWQYGVPTTFTLQSNPIPHRELTPQQDREYHLQRSYHGPGPETISKYLARLAYRVRFCRFFLLPPLWIAAIAFLAALREPRYAWLAGTLLLFFLGTNFYPMFLPHYVAAVTCLVILASVVGLERLNRISPFAARVIVLLCAAHFLFWYGVHIFDDGAGGLRRFESWDAINHENPVARIFVRQQLARLPGRQLVFVHYAAGHRFQEEWVYNDADIDAATVVWARDLGAEENDKLLRYYPGRTTWLLDPDDSPPRLTRITTR